MNQNIPNTSQPGIVQPSNAKNSSKRPIHKIIIIAVLLAIATGGGYIAFSLFRWPSTKQLPTTKIPITPQAEEPSPHYVGHQTITLHDLTGGTSSGTATRNIVPGSISSSFHATLPDPPEGEFYQVWIVKSGDQFALLGKLYKDYQGLYSITDAYKFDPSDPPFTTFDEIYNTVVITLETTDDNQMGNRLLEGTFTE